MARISLQSRIGNAGEYLVCADLAMQGHSASMAPAGEPYDIITSIDGKLKTIQVKTVSKGSDGKYNFTLCSRTNRSSNREREKVVIDVDSVDILALVALDIKSVAYFDKDFMLSHRFRAVLRSDSGKNSFKEHSCVERSINTSLQNGQQENSSTEESA